MKKICGCTKEDIIAMVQTIEDIYGEAIDNCVNFDRELDLYLLDYPGEDKDRVVANWAFKHNDEDLVNMLKEEVAKAEEYENDRDATTKSEVKTDSKHITDQENERYKDVLKHLRQAIILLKHSDYYAVKKSAEEYCEFDDYIDTINSLGIDLIYKFMK